MDRLIMDHFLKYHFSMKLHVMKNIIILNLKKSNLTIKYKNFILSRFSMKNDKY